MYLSEPVLARVRFLLALLIDLHAENMADWADRWARGRVDSPDKNRAPHALDTYKPPAISKPAQKACSLSRGEVPEAEAGTRRRAVR
jgi:hypothetical protein